MPKTDVAPVYGIYGQNGSVIDNEGQINIASSKAVNTSAVFGIYGNSAEINNNGSIKIGDGGNLFNAATGIRADNKNVNNSGTVRIYGAGTAISAENGNIVNNSGGSITMVISGAADSYGIYLAGRGSNTLTNNATVKVNRSSAYAEGKKAVALYAENGSINNSGALEVGAKDAVINGGIGIETDGGNVTNGGTITVYGNGSAIKAADGSITNNASATVYGNGSVLNGQNGNVTNNEKGQLNIYTDGKASAYGLSGGQHRQHDHQQGLDLHQPLRRICSGGLDRQLRHLDRQCENRQFRRHFPRQQHRRSERHLRSVCRRQRQHRKQRRHQSLRRRHRDLHRFRNG